MRAIRSCRPSIGITSQGEAKPQGQRGGESSDRWYRHQSPEIDRVNFAILACFGRSYDKYVETKSTEQPTAPSMEVDHLSLKEDLSTGLGDLGQTMGPCGFDLDPCSPEAISDIRAMIAEARGQGPSVVEALRSIFASEVWHLAIGTA